jgi:hypothetical protein
MALITITIDTDDERITDLINDLIASGLYPETLPVILEDALPYYYNALIERHLNNGLDTLEVNTFNRAVKDIRRRNREKGIADHVRK